MSLPTTEPAKRIGALFKRRLSTHWTDREVIVYKHLVKAGYFKDMNDLELVERYYVFERRKGDDGIHRRDMQTFLNNYPGELDRAKLWDIRFRRPRPAPKKDDGTPVSEDEWKRIGELAKKEMELLRERLKGPESEQAREYADGPIAHTNPNQHG